METFKELEYDLYQNSGDVPVSFVGRGIKRLKKYFLSPSTHGGFYFAGIGCMVGGAGGILREISSSIYSEGPEIVSEICSGCFGDAAVRTGVVLTNALVNSSYFSGLGGFIGYLGGSLVTGKIWDYVSSFFSSENKGGG